MSNVIENLISSVREGGVSGSISSEIRNSIIGKKSHHEQSIFRLGDLSTERRRGQHGGSDDQLQAIILAYYLNNANKYDEQVSKMAIRYGLSEDKIVLLTLLNSAEDVKGFCEGENLNASQTRNILGLKRLSALYNLHHNF